MEALEKFDREQQTQQQSMPPPSASQTTTSAGGSAAGPAPTTRADMVAAAKQFLSAPRVRQTAWEEQRRFLRDKGLTDAEIDEAAESLHHNGLIAGNSKTPPGVTPQQLATVGEQGTGSRLLHWTNNAVLVGGASWLAYKLMRGWVLPRFFDIPDPAQERIELLQAQMNELQNSTKFIMDSVVQTLETVSAQQEQLNRALVLMSNHGGGGGPHAGQAAGVSQRDVDRLHADLGIVKSLLLNQSQFPPPIPLGQSKTRGTLSNGSHAGRSAGHNGLGSIGPTKHSRARSGPVEMPALAEEPSPSESSTTTTTTGMGNECATRHEEAENGSMNASHGGGGLHGDNEV